MSAGAAGADRGGRETGAGAAGADPGEGRWGALERALARLPSWLAPRDSDEARGRGRRLRIEAVVLLAVAALIAVASVYDLTREVKYDNRLTADIETWRETTGIPDEEVAVEQDLASYSTRDTACGSVNPDKYAVSARLCLMISGPVSGNRRKVLGGYYLPMYLPIGPNDRYGCFGSTVAEKFCAYAPPETLPNAVPKGFRDSGEGS